MTDPDDLSPPRACPRCGALSDGHAWCQRCGLNLRLAAAQEGETKLLTPAQSRPFSQAPTPFARAWQHVTRTVDPMVLTGIAVAIAVVAVIVAVVLATKGGGSPSTPELPGVAAATTFSTEATASESTPIESSTESASTETTTTTIESAQAEQALNEYAQDYSNEDLEGLKGLFAEGFEREEENKPSEDVATALETYEHQFSELKEPSYTLSEQKVEPGTGEASATARYSITSQNGTVTGSITFHLIANEEKVLIDKITVKPSR